VLPRRTGPSVPERAGGPSRLARAAEQAGDRAVLEDLLKDDARALLRDPGRRVSCRFERRDITTGGSSNIASTFFPNLATRGSGCTPPLTNGICQTTSSSGDLTPFQINDHAALFGAALRTAHGLRIATDVELHSADNVFTSIMPRHSQRYRVKGSYAPTQWLNLAANLRINEMRNLSEGLGNRQHDRPEHERRTDDVERDLGWLGGGGEVKDAHGAAAYPSSDARATNRPPPYRPSVAAGWAW